MHSKKISKSLGKKIIESAGILFSIILFCIAVAFAATTWDPGMDPQAAPGSGNVTLSGGGGGGDLSGTISTPTFSYVDTDTIGLTGGGYYLDGIGAVYWNSALTLDFPGLAADTWYYIYLDASAITAAGTITASKLTAYTTAPTWSDSKHGWYNSSDRIIFAVLTDASSNIKEFTHEGDAVMFAEKFYEIGGSPIAGSNQTWVDYTMNSPAFTKALFVSAMCDTYGGSGYGLDYRKDGAVDNGGSALCKNEAETDALNASLMMTGDNGAIELRSGTSNVQSQLWMDGFKLPNSMTEVVALGAVGSSSGGSSTPNVLTDIEVVSKTCTTRDCNVSCPVGKIATGGGCSFDNYSHDNYPADIDADGKVDQWRCTDYAGGSFDDVTAFVICGTEVTIEGGGSSSSSGGGSGSCSEVINPVEDIGGNDYYVLGEAASLTKYCSEQGYEFGHVTEFTFLGSNCAMYRSSGWELFGTPACSYASKAICCSMDGSGSSSSGGGGTLETQTTVCGVKTCDCPAGWLVTGGGCEATGRLEISKANGNGWICDNRGTFIESSVTCARLQ